jgi:hypothetical protein
VPWGPQPILTWVGRPLRNCKVPVSTKRHHVRIDGEPHNVARPAFPADAVNGRDEITKRQRLLLVIGFHGITIRRETVL